MSSYYPRRCSELAPAFRQLLARPTQLQLMGAETYPTARPVPPSANTATATAMAGRGDKADTGAGTAAVAGQQQQRSMDRELAVEGPTDMGVLVYQMVQQTQLK